MISNVMALACLLFWGQTCPISCHEDCLHQAIVATKRIVRRPTCKVLIELAWDLDAARFRDYEGPVNCTCANKQRLVDLLTRLYHTAPVNIRAHHMWALVDAWDAPTPIDH